MFTIGEDLTKMQVVTNTDEADVGKLKPGMDASFTVDAYPGETFHGTIRQVRLAATTVQNVVTYNAVIDVANPDLRLKPGMTANVKVVIEKVDNMLRLPNAAIRFRPTLTDMEMADAFKRAGEERFYSYYQGRAQSGNAAGIQVARTGGMDMGSSSGTPNRGGQTAGTTPNRGRLASIWVQGSDKLLRPVILKLGLTDGVQTQIVEGKLNQGDKVILSAEIGGNNQTLPTSSRMPGMGSMPMGRGVR
jgi:HlyD family secretion protein